MKRILLTLLAVALVWGVTGCGGSDDPPASSQAPASSADSTSGKPDWLTDDLSFDGRTFIVSGHQDWSPREGICEGTDKFVQRIAQCEEQYDFKLEYYQTSESTYRELLQTSAMSGEYVADIWYCQSYDLIPGLAKAGLVYCLDDYNIFDYTNPKWDLGLMDTYSWQGKRYGFMSDGTYDTYQNLGQGIFFNKDMFARESVETPYDLYARGEWTWDALRDLGVAMTKDTDNDGKNDQYGLALQGDYYTFLAANNAAIVKQDDSGRYQYALSENNAVEALEYFFSLQELDVHAPWLGDWHSSRLTPFIEGKIAMLTADWWIAYTHLSERMTEDYGWVPFPIGPSGDTYRLYRGSSNIWVIPKSVSEPEKAMMMYDLISDHEDWKNNPDAYRSYVESRVRDDETIAVFGDMWSQDVNAYDLARSVSGLQALCRQSIDQAWNGEASAKTVVDAVAVAAQDLIDSTLNS